MTALHEAPAFPARLLAGSDVPHGSPPADTDAVLAELDRSGLCGRGGAGFPLSRKIAAVRAAAGAPIVVANGAEGEPASDKDRQLLTRSPQLVLDGLQLAARLVGAREIHLVVQPRPDLHRSLTVALTQRVDPIAVRLSTAAEGYLAGQESAVLNTLAGRAGRPTYTPVRVSQAGLRGRPTLVSNVETLAHLALIGRHGAEWYRGAGTAAEPGSMLSTIRRMDGSATVAEVAFGTPIAALLGPGCGAGVLIGGYHGTWLPSSVARTLTLDNASLAPYGASVGAGVLAELPGPCCGLVETASVLRYLALESAGQCGPCLNGLPQIAGAFLALADCTAGPIVLADLRRWSDLVVGRGACAHPDGSVRLLRSALRAFASEVDCHIGAGRGPGTRRCTGSVLPFLPVQPFLPVPRRHR